MRSFATVHSPNSSSSSSASSASSSSDESLFRFRLLLPLEARAPAGRRDRCLDACGDGPLPLDPPLFGVALPLVVERPLPAFGAACWPAVKRLKSISPSSSVFSWVRYFFGCLVLIPGEVIANFFLSNFQVAFRPSLLVQFVEASDFVTPSLGELTASLVFRVPC